MAGHVPTARPGAAVASAPPVRFDAPTAAYETRAAPVVLFWGLVETWAAPVVLFWVLVETWAAPVLPFRGPNETETALA